MRSPKQHQRGYSLIELLVVIALIGVLSLVAVPSFMSMMNTNRMSSTIRQFASDVRGARGRAVSQGRPTKISVVPAATNCAADVVDCPARTYSMSDCTSVDGAGKITGCTAVWTRTIDKTTWFNDTTNFDDVDETANGDVDIVFRTDGTLVSAPASAKVVIRSDRKIVYNEADFNMNVAGTVSTTKTSF